MPGGSTYAIEDQRSLVFENPETVNIWVETDGWPDGLPDEIAREIWMPWMQIQTQYIIRQLTGRRWRGGFNFGPKANRPTAPDGSLDPDGWIIVQVRDTEAGGCGDWALKVGAEGDKGRIHLEININPPEGRSHCNLRGFAHEMAHVLGFWHVGGTIPLDIGGTETDPGDIEYNPAMQYHARLAYEIGRGRPYCGWPYGPSCAQTTPDAAARRDPTLGIRTR